MATNFGAKFANQPSFGTLAFLSGLKYSNICKRIAPIISLHRVQIWCNLVHWHRRLWQLATF